MKKKHPEFDVNVMRGSKHACNSLCKMDCYVYGCPEAGHPDCNLFEKLPDTGAA